MTVRFQVTTTHSRHVPPSRNSDCHFTRAAWCGQVAACAAYFLLPLFEASSACRLIAPMSWRWGGFIPRYLKGNRNVSWHGSAVTASAIMAGGALVSDRQNQPALCLQRSLHDFYRRVEESAPLGIGSYGSVFPGIHHTSGEVVAIKFIPRDTEKSNAEAEADAWRVRLEAELLRLGGEHRNCADLLDFFDEEDGAYLVMEFAAGGELFDRLAELGAYSERQASTIMREVTDAVAYSHTQVGSSPRATAPPLLQLFVCGGDSNSASHAHSPFLTFFYSASHPNLPFLRELSGLRSAWCTLTSSRRTSS